MLFKNKSKKSILIRFSLLIPVMLLAFALQSGKSIETSAKPHVILNNPVTSPLNTIEETSVDSSKATNEHTDTHIFTSVEEPPDPIGGLDAFYKYIGENAHFSKEAYPASGVTSNVRVLVSFIVEVDGSLSTIKSLRDPGHGTFEETKRLLENAPKWKPGIQNKRPVRVQFTLPIQLNSSTES